ncbi:MAG: single-stranded-DNA-specific exonuclease RecJ [Anaerolineae bacterium]|nr:single-stranded-DNA-specific exonuclease RecJ [Anaerolineae bacterium]MDW8098976.1 single-stranded-DNA-specific exonuclease RecJ [Anaerolineae bacterium]
MRSRKRWVVGPPPPSEVAKRLSHLHPVLVRVLVHRGITTPAEAEAFLYGSHLFDNPYHLKGVNEAVTRLRDALRRGERIAVYGDFDADGVTSTALMTLTLRALGADVRPYIPHRVDEGYGLNFEALKQLKSEGCRVVVTVDCGIRSIEEVAFGQRLGLDMIVTDHHTPGPELPPARAVVNPKRPDSRYPFPSLAGVGVAYRLAQGLLRAARRNSWVTAEGLKEEDLLDLVALGTVADIVPLLGENRTLVRLGLARLNEPTRLGIRELMHAASVLPGRVTAWTIGFILAPRLNAAGRLRTGMLAYDLLTTQDPGQAITLAAELDVLNQRRQELTRRHAEEALATLASTGTQMAVPYLHVVASPGYEHGIVGLIASQIAEVTYRPTVVVHLGEEESRGSARSIPEFDITAALDQCRDLLVRHGGHAAAAGFTIRTEHLPALQERLQAIAQAELADKDLTPKLHIDAEVTLKELNRDLYEQLKLVEPCGHGNEPPVLMARGLAVRRSRVVGDDGQHLRLVVSDGRLVFDAIAFRQAHLAENLPTRVDLAFTLDISERNGERYFELNVLDLRPAEG